MSSGPPKLLRRLLEWLLPPGPVRDGLLGDLDELYRERAGAGRLSADLWYARQLQSAAVHYAARRLLQRRARRERTGMIDNVRVDIAYALRTPVRARGSRPRPSSRSAWVSRRCS